MKTNYAPYTLLDFLTAVDISFHPINQTWEVMFFEGRTLFARILVGAWEAGRFSDDDIIDRKSVV